jgi:hypothetical protein
VGLWKYVKTAFYNHWNLLFVAGGTAAAFISGQPDIGLPLIAAAEIAYLGGLATHPKFQGYVEAQEAKQNRQSTSVSSQRALEKIMQALPRESLDRFLQLRQRCVELEQIAADLKQPGETENQPLEGFYTEGLDRLLWIHLRLLYSQYALAKFLNRTSDDQISVDIKRIEQRLAEIPKENVTDQQQRVRQALEDNLQTSRDRLSNVQKAKDNFEFVKLELERVETKIRSLGEMAINRHEPGYVSTQVDQVAHSMKETEKTMNELQFVTGLENTDEAPDLMRNKMLVTR